MRNYRFIGFDDIYFGAKLAKLARDYVACDSGSRQQDALFSHFVSQSFYHRFGYVLLRNDIHFKSVFLDGFFGCGPDSCDLQMFQLSLRQAKFIQPLPKGFNSIHAGQDQPIVFVQILESSVQRFVRAGLADFDEGNLRDFRAERSQA